MDWQTKLGLAASIIFALLPYPVIAMPRWLSRAGIVAGLLFAGWDFLPSSSRFSTVQEILISLLIVSLVAYSFYILEQSSVGKADNLSATHFDPEKALAQITPLLDELKRKQQALNESDYTRGLLAGIVGHFNTIKSSITIHERFTGKRDDAQRLAAAEHIFKELSVVLQNFKIQNTPQGDVLWIHLARNTFRITFSGPMRIAPQISFFGLPPDVTPNIIEHSNLGFTVIFTPPTIEVLRFDFFASAEI